MTTPAGPGESPAEPADVDIIAAVHFGEAEDGLVQSAAVVGVKLEGVSTIASKCAVAPKDMPPFRFAIMATPSGRPTFV